MKVQISMNDDLVKRIDNYVGNNYMTRSGLITLACNQYLGQAEVIGAIKEMALAMRKIADTGTIDDETIEMLEDFERISKMLTGQK